MAQLATLVGGLGYLVAVLWLLTVARRVSFAWFLLCLFASPFAVLFLATHWAEARRPFFLQAGSVMLLILGLAGGDDLEP